MSNSDKEVAEMSAAAATNHINKMLELETRGRGDLDRAMGVVARKTGLTFWQVSHLRKGNAKTCDVSVFVRIKLAYLATCAEMIDRLQHEIQLEGQVSNADFSDLEHEAALLAAKVAAKKAALRLEKQKGA